MLALMPILSLFAPFLPDLLHYFQSRQDQAHELEMHKLDVASAERVAALQVQGQTQVAQLSLEGSLAQADVADLASARAMMPDLGNKLLEAVMALPAGWLAALVRGPTLLAFTAIEMVNELVRPTVTYIFVAMYAATKAARFYLYLQTGNLHDLATLAAACTAIWDEQDGEIVLSILAFWFAMKHRQNVAAGK